MKSKKILLVAPPFIPTSQDSIAGTEQMTYLLGRALAEQGHDITTIAREDSEVYGKLIPGGFKDMPRHEKAELEYFHQAMAFTTSQVREFIRKNPDLDTIIDRCEGISLPTSIEENGPPIISGLDMSSKYFLNQKIFSLLKPSLKERQDKFVAPSKYIANEYKNNLDFKGIESSNGPP